MATSKKKTAQKKKAAGKPARLTPKTFKPTATQIKAAPQRAQAITPLLRQLHPDAACALLHKSPLQLLVATILSAQCTDERVNMVTPDLFKKYPNAQAFAKADMAELQTAIKSTGFFRNKAKNIQAACRDIVSQHKKKVPQTLDELTALAGVGRKTANVILGNAYGQPAITTDTHVIRLSRLLALSKNSDPVKLEFDLQKLFPPEDWTDISHLLIFHGRRVCNARKPDCPNCPLRPHCPYGSAAVST